jgi:uncharacterized phiE125 gp8 family phage protein
MISLAIVTEPTSEPLALTAARLHLRLDTSGSPPSHPEDALVTVLIEAARQVVERELNGRVLMPQTWKLSLDGFPDQGIQIPMAPVNAISSITYVDTNGVTQTWGADQYRVDLDSIPARITPEYGIPWPVTRGVMKTVVVTFTAGYDPAGSPASPVPELILAALKLILGDLYENREETAVGVQVMQIPRAAADLLARYRLAIP